MAQKRQKGFTLVEILVVTAVIAIISSIMIVNWRKNEGQYQLQRAAQEIAQTIRKAQDYALSGNRMFWSPTGEWVVPRYYGVHFERDNPTFFIYGDWIGNEGYQNPEDIQETYVTLETGIQFDSFGGGNTLDIMFNLPDGITSFSKSGDYVTITIKRTGKTCPSVYCRNIIVRKTGEVVIQ